MDKSAERREIAFALLLLVAVFAAYAPALGGGLVWDDSAHITLGALQGWDGLLRIWLEPGVTQQYYPVLHSAFWLEHRLWGDSVTGYHLMNAGLHAIAAILVAVLGQRLEVRGAWLGAFVFALHPVNVESVAWISEQKNTLSLVLALMAALAWLRFDASRARRDWLVGSGLFLLALGSKTTVATLPCALLVIVWWKRGHIAWRRDVAPLLPWLVAGIAAGLTTAWIERHVIGAEGTEFMLSPLQRTLLAGRALWHYLATFVWPASLVFTYPRWTIDARDAVAYAYPAAIAAVAAVLWTVRRHTRAPLAAFLIFAGVLFPVLGFLSVYPFRYAYVADHFQYHASIPLALLAAAGLAWAGDRVAAGARTGMRWAAAGATLVVPGVLILSLAVLTWRQAGDYRDAETLYRATLARNPSSWMAHHNLGRLMSRTPGGLEEAIAHFQLALALKPDHARAHYSLGVALQRAGRGREAVPHLQAAIRLEPNNRPLVANAEFLLGTEALRRPDGATEAVAHFEAALRLKPGVAETEAALAEARRRAAASSSSPRSR
ncbi:MAG TPA: tetratricopeptide repeat protein [Gemmatimonadaceae bacterium]